MAAAIDVPMMCPTVAHGASRDASQCHAYHPPVTTSATPRKTAPVAHPQASLPMAWLIDSGQRGLTRPWTDQR